MITYYSYNDDIDDCYIGCGDGNYHLWSWKHSGQSRNSKVQSMEHFNE